MSTNISTSSLTTTELLNNPEMAMDMTSKLKLNKTNESPSPLPPPSTLLNPSSESELSEISSSTTHQNRHVRTPRTSTKRTKNPSKNSSKINPDGTKTTKKKRKLSPNKSTSTSNTTEKTSNMITNSETNANETSTGKRIKKKDKYWTKEKLLDIKDDLTKEFLNIFQKYHENKDQPASSSNDEVIRTTPNTPQTPTTPQTPLSSYTPNHLTPTTSQTNTTPSQFIPTDPSLLHTPSHSNNSSLENLNLKVANANAKKSLKNDLLDFINEYNDNPIKGTNYSKIFMEIILNAFLLPEFVDIRDWIEAHFKITSDSYSSRFKRDYDYFSTTGYLISKKTCDKPRDIKIRIIHQKAPDDEYKLGISFNINGK